MNKGNSLNMEPKPDRCIMNRWSDGRTEPEPEFRLPKLWFYFPLNSSYPTSGSGSLQFWFWLSYCRRRWGAPQRSFLLFISCSGTKGWDVICDNPAAWSRSSVRPDLRLKGWPQSYVTHSHTLLGVKRSFGFLNPNPEPAATADYSQQPVCSINPILDFPVCSGMIHILFQTSG